MKNRTVTAQQPVKQLQAPLFPTSTVTQDTAPITEDRFLSLHKENHVLAGPRKIPLSVRERYVGIFRKFS